MQQRIQLRQLVHRIHNFLPKSPEGHHLQDVLQYQVRCIACVQTDIQIVLQGSANEVVAASVVHLEGVATDRGTPRQEWDSRARLRNFSVVRKLDGQPFPPGENSKPQTLNPTIAVIKSKPHGRTSSVVHMT